MFEGETGALISAILVNGYIWMPILFAGIGYLWRHSLIHGLIGLGIGAILWLIMLSAILLPGATEKPQEETPSAAQTEGN